MQSRRFVIAALALSASVFILGAPLTAARAADDTVLIPCVCELSGDGAVSGTNFRDGAHIAVDEINAAGGILGKKIQMADYDTQTDPQTSRALIQKAVDSGAYAIMGTVYSGSTIVNMIVAQQAGVPQFTGAEAPNITQQGNSIHLPHLLRRGKGRAVADALFQGHAEGQEDRRCVGQQRLRQGRDMTSSSTR